MEEQIYDTNDNFSFQEIVLTPPTLVSGGNYFIKCLIHEHPLYIQPPKCQTKGGISTSGKKKYCDLMFTNDHEQFIRWMENLENYIYKYIYDHREKWFETELDLHDIENSFASPLKIYKSGKYYIARTNVPVLLGKCNLKIYNEQREEVDMEKIVENSNVITILEIQGIKCSPRSFQIEIELKQMMVLKPSKIFEKCIIMPSSSSKPEKEEEVPAKKPENEEEVPIEKPVKEEEEVPIEEPVKEEEEVPIEEPVKEEEEPHNNSSSSPQEIQFDLEKIPEEESITLKNRADVYYERYREARRKAKIARKVALSAYLEAKHIKNTYMLDDLKTSDESDLEDNDLDFE